MAIALRGFRGVVWSKHQATFPFVTGMTPVFLSWVVSPVLAGICVAILYGAILRPFVLRSKNSFARALVVRPGSCPQLAGIAVEFLLPRP